MNLILSVVWLVAAVVLFIWCWIEPNSRYNKILASDVPLGWFALVVSLYLFVRWWSVRQLNRVRRTPSWRPPPRPVVRPDDEETPDGRNQFPPLTD